MNRNKWKFPAAFDNPYDWDFIDRYPWRPITAPPEPHDEDTYRAWGRKHFGEGWDEDREEMINNRDMYAFRDNVQGDELFLLRQMRLRRLEARRERRMHFPACKPWRELLKWARWFYGESYLDQLASIAEDMKSPHRRVVQNAKTRARRVREATWDRHEDVLAAGYTWDEIMAWPRLPPRLLCRSGKPVDFASIGPKAGDACASDDGDKNDKNDSTQPTAADSPPADLRRMAIAGPQHSRPYALEVRTMQNINNEQIPTLKSAYETSVAMLERASYHIRSVREEALAQARNTEAWYDAVLNQQVVSVARGTFTLPEQPHVLHESKLKERHDRNTSILRAMPEERPMMRIGHYDTWDNMHDRWAVQGITLDEANYLIDNVYFPGPKGPNICRFNYTRERPDYLRQEVIPLTLAPPQVQSRVPPKDEAEMAELFRFWDGKLHDEEKLALAEMYGFHTMHRYAFDHTKEERGQGRENGDEDNGDNGDNKGNEDSGDNEGNEDSGEIGETGKDKKGQTETDEVVKKDDRSQTLRKRVRGLANVSNTIASQPQASGTPERARTGEKRRRRA